MNLSDEQKRIVEAVEKYDRIRIMALAGTGKTTTLKAIAEAYQDKKILFLAFNNSVKAECQKKFPKNTDVFTIHSLAYKHYRSIYNNASPNTFNLNVYTLEEYIDLFTLESRFGKEFKMSIKHRKSLPHYELKTLFQMVSVLKTIYEDYLYSDIEDLKTYIKVSEYYHTFIELAKEFLSCEKTALDDAYEFLSQLFDLQINNKIQVSHDVYVKWFANSLPDIFVEKYDIVCLDEAQDTNAVAEQILEKLPIRKKVIVGDAHQKIYGFRKAVAVLDLWRADITLALTTTYRCPDDVCEYANRILKWKNSDLFLKSNKKSSNEECKDTAYLTRSNSSLIEVMLMLIEKGTRYKIIRQIEEIFKLPLAIEEYFNNNKEYAKKVSPVFKEEFFDMEELSKYADENDDIELLYALRIVKKIYEDGMRIKDAYKTCKANIDYKSNIVLATAHSAKGLEWDQVYVWDDFPYLPREVAKLMLRFDIHNLDDVYNIYKDLLDTVYRKKEYTKRPSLNLFIRTIEEINLYYVATTRAKNILKDYSANAIIRDRKEFELETMKELDALKKQKQ